MTTIQDRKIAIKCEIEEILATITPPIHDIESEPCSEKQLNIDFGLFNIEDSELEKRNTPSGRFLISTAIIQKT